MVRKKGNGENTDFWRDVWVGNTPLCFTSPHIYSIANQNKAKVREIMEVSEGGV